MRRAVAAALLAAACSAGGATASAPVSPASAPSRVQPPPPRGGEQTFLTLPEWFLVFSPAEYAKFIVAHGPSEFPFIGHIGQFWQSYDAAWRATRSAYPFNVGYHAMIWVIGLSTSVEYTLRSAYETLVGQLAEATAGARTDEEGVAIAVARRYVDFIRVRPWYAFDFVAAIGELWSQPSWGPAPVRKWERRWALTTEWGLKAGYGWLIGKATGLTYDSEPETTAVLLAAGRSSPADAAARKAIPWAPAVAPGVVATTLPRYQAFTAAAIDVAAHGREFVEIAGNRGDIAISVVAASDWYPKAPTAQAVVRQNLLTETGRVRTVLRIPVAQLSAALNGWRASGATIEHVFDY